ncbi:uncharacterized protein [Physcomitrium patens]|uniref:uncharacterized protein isoform X4 n=1 Tax=Physcomitrium patens TaxID=3218 RepID=UPI003CCD642D
MVIDIRVGQDVTLHQRSIVDIGGTRTKSDQVRISLCNYSTSSNCSRTAYTSPTGARNATTQPWHCRKMIDLKRTPFARTRPLRSIL